MKYFWVFLILALGSLSSVFILSKMDLLHSTDSVDHADYRVQPNNKENYINQTERASKNALTRFKDALREAEYGDVREALTELLDLRYQPHVDLDVTSVENAVQHIVDKHVAHLENTGGAKAVLDFLSYLIALDNSNQRYIYLLGSAQFRWGQELEALDTLSTIIYNPDWGPSATEIIDTVNKRDARLRVEAKRALEQEQQKQRLLAQRQQRHHIPLQRIGNHFVVNARIDNKSQIRLIIDTGATITAINRGKIPTGGQVDRRIWLQTAGDRRRADIYRVNHFSVEGIEISDMEIALLDLSHIEHADGLLGMNYLSRFDFYLDQDEPALYLRQRTQSKAGTHP